MLDWIINFSANRRGMVLLFVVLLGGLDLSIPFVIGSANIALMYLFGFEVLPN